jgi:hypothetical protein
MRQPAVRAVARRALFTAASPIWLGGIEALTWDDSTENAHAQRKARRGIPERMYNTSPLTRTVLGEPAAPETRRLLHSEARAKTKLAGGFATSKAAGSGSRGEGGAGEASQSQRAAHGILSDGHRAELYKLSTKLQSTRNALPDKRYK